MADLNATHLADLKITFRSHDHVPGHPQLGAVGGGGHRREAACIVLAAAAPVTNTLAPSRAAAGHAGSANEPAACCREALPRLAWMAGAARQNGASRERGS